MTKMSDLLKKKAAFTVNLLMQAACELVDEMDVADLSFKKVSSRAGMSERTMFRYFTTRDAFLDALTATLYADLQLPDIPDEIDSLPCYIETLYRQLDAHPRKVMVLLSGDLLPRILRTTAKQRLMQLQTRLTEAYPDADTALITMTAANLRYVMSASSWRYYRVHFRFDLATSIRCAQLLVSQSLRFLDEQNNQSGNDARSTSRRAAE